MGKIQKSQPLIDKKLRRKKNWIDSQQKGVSVSVTSDIIE